MEKFYKFNNMFGRRNKTFMWLGIDSEELYDKHFANPKKRKILQELGWKKDSITYTFNSEGYRSPEFEKNGIVCFGCSNTLGVGVNYEQTWPYLLGESLNLPVCNFGVGGSSTDTAFRLANYWIAELQPKYVFYLRPERSRREYVHVDNPIHIEDMSVWRSDSKYFLLTHDYADIIHDQKNSIGLEYICNKNNAKYYDISRWDIKDFTKEARDLEHSGPPFWEYVRNLFLEKM